MPPISAASKNIIIINALAFLASYMLTNIDINNMFGLHYWASSEFNVWQLLTFMFLHGSFSHLFFNMFAVYMFGAPIEQYFGTQRYIIYYLITGIGSGLVQEVALYFEIQPFIRAVDVCMSDLTNSSINNLLSHYGPASQKCLILINEFFNKAEGMPIQEAMPIARQFLMDYQEAYIASHNTIGASGAVFGLLLAFGMLYPNARIFLFFLIPIKAKYFVLLYGAIELFEGLGVIFKPDNVAHWAHLGGMLFGIVLILKWRRE
ncbi:MAG: rhomboid family intramembrane serine protease [Bacteroidales bacterium]|nr:rhomboid family intramembrane serine protease [Bacteroidales bacterium]